MTKHVYIFIISFLSFLVANMESVINSSVLFHIAKKIIMFMDYNDKTLPIVIKNLRLVCKTWRDIIDSNELCKMWQSILRKKGSLTGPLVTKHKIWDLIDIICDQTFEIKDRKLNWIVSHFLLLNFKNKNHINPEYWPSYSLDKTYWENFGNFETFTRSVTYPTLVEMFLCHCPIKLLDRIPKDLLETATSGTGMLKI